MRQASPLVRQWLVIRTLGSRQSGATVQELAAEQGVVEKTIRRDLAAIAMAGFPLAEKTCNHGQKRYHLQYPQGAPGLAFSWDEALALYLGRRFLDPLAGTFLWQAAQRAFAKVRSALGPQALRYLDHMAGHVHATAVGASDYSRHGERIDALVRGIEERRVTFITYQSQRAAEPAEREVLPYGIVWHRGSLYLVAYAAERKEVRHFKVDRVTEVRLSDNTFEMPARFDLQAHLAGSFGVFQAQDDVLVRVRFSAEAARYVEEGQWHASQQLRREHGGSLLAQFRLSGTEEIKRWLLSFGRRAEVLEPAALRAEMAEELAATARNYAAPRRAPSRPLPR